MSKTKPLCFILTILTMTLLLGYLAFAWQDPTQAPPGDNVPVPINVGSTEQRKTGNLTLPNLYLNATGFEGNIYAIDQLIGFNDIFVKGNSAETAPVYLAGNQISAYTGGTERLRITLAGNVGIGTASPAQKLHVANYIRADQGFCIGTNCITSWPATGAPVGASYVVMSLDGTLTNERRLTAGSGISVSDGGANSNVTVSADTSYLQRRVTGSCPSDSAIRIINADGTVSCVTVGTGTVSGSGTTNYIPYWTGSTSLGNSVIYQSAGAYVGIGTASPGTKLDVSGGAVRTNNQLISTVATGTAPLAVSSTTVVTNLNADLLDGEHASALKWPEDIVCGTGFTDMGTYCIQTNENTAKTWWSASGYCQDNYGGARLCSMSEWYNACRYNKLTNGTNNYEWVDDWGNYGYVLVIGSGSCESVYSYGPSYNITFRCCK